MLKRIATLPLRFYRKVLSPLKRGPTCRFLPTCSEYAEQAVMTHGVLRGGGLAIARLVRCHPFCRGGYDPVPPLVEREPASRALGSTPSEQSRYL